MSISETQRKKNNADRLLKISPSIRAHVAAVIAELETAGYRPQIDGQVWRSPAQQAALKARGVSKVSYSFHNATTANGGPDALAADIVDVRWMWDAPNHYWLRLAAAAEQQGLVTGIYWGLSTAQRKAIAKTIGAKDWDAKLVLGWDTAHVEPADFSIARAKSGERPKLEKVKQPTPLRFFVRTNQRNSTQVQNAYTTATATGTQWNLNEEQFAQLLGEANFTPGVISSVPVLLKRWGWVAIKYTPNPAQNRVDLYVVTKEEAAKMKVVVA